MQFKHVPHGVASVTLKDLSIIADRLVPPKPGITLLIYHRVGRGSSSAVDLSTDRFEAQLEHLAIHHRVIRLGNALEELSSSSVEPAVVLTFDDGTADFAEHAMPLLAKYGTPATLYLATAFVDGALPWFDGSCAISRAALQDTVASGWVDVGSHTHRHSLLDRLPPRELADELDRSIDLIGEWLGITALDFAYPKAVAPSSAADRAVRERFRSAALATPGPNRYGQDFFALNRTPIQTSDRQRHLSAKFVGGMRMEGALRASTNRVRYRRQLV